MPAVVPNNFGVLVRTPGAFVQNVLPWLTSLAFHAALLAVGLFMYQSVKVLLHRQTQTAPAETPLLVSSVTDGLNDGFHGNLSDPTRPTIQTEIQDPAANGTSWARAAIGQASAPGTRAPKRNPRRRR